MKKKKKKKNHNNNCKKKYSKKNQRMQSILSIVLVIVVSISMAIPIAVSAATGKDYAQLALIQEGDFSSISGESANANASVLSTASAIENDPAQKYIYESLMDCMKTFNMYAYKIHINDFRNIYCNVINDNPDLFYVSSSVTYSYYKSSGYVAVVTPKYSMAQEEIEGAKAIFYAGAEEALSVVDDSMTDLQKALVIHDYICDLATYPYDAMVNVNYRYHSAYGFFYDRRIVCAGYALAYSYLMHRLGIECEYVAASAMGHAWNAIKIDDKWYNVDLTYDDTSFYNNQMNVRGGIYHSCFMKSTDALESELCRCHYGGTTLDTCDLNNTDYDDYFWNDVNTNIYVIDGDYYYLDIDPDNNSDRLVKRTVDGQEEQVGSCVFSYESTDNPGVYKDESGVKHNICTTDTLDRLVYLDNRFYITSYNYIISYNNMTGDYEAYPIHQDGSSDILGLGKDDSGNLVYQRFDDYETVVLDKEEFFRANITTQQKDAYNNYVDINMDKYVNAKDYDIIINRN